MNTKPQQRDENLSDVTPSEQFQPQPIQFQQVQLQPQKSWVEKIGKTGIPRIQTKPADPIPIKLTKDCRILRYTVSLETADGYSEIEVAGAITLNSLFSSSSIPEALRIFNGALKNMIIEPVQREFAHNLNKYKDRVTPMKTVTDTGVVYSQPNIMNNATFLYPGQTQ